MDEPRKSLRRAVSGWLAGLCLAGLFAWQGWMTLQLFGPDDPVGRMLDDDPVVSGSHPLHQYHGHLGARAYLTTGQSCCYDPAFQAGYPKTPIFDSGSRPAEVFMILGGGDFRPSAYKVGLFVIGLLAPALMWLAGRGAGLGPLAACLSTAAGLLVWWGEPCQDALEAGDLELLLAGLALLAHVGLLALYHRRPGPANWLGLTATAWLGWFAHPLVFPVTFPLFLIYYLSVGAKHRHLIWHLGLFASQGVGLGLNAFWLQDWVRHWWIRSPLPAPMGLLQHRTFRSFWEADLWGHPADRLLALVLLGSGVAGLVTLELDRRRVAARLLGLGTLALLALALLGISWEPLGRLGTACLLLPALWFASVPAAHFWAWIARDVCRWSVEGRLKAVAAACLVGGVAVFSAESLAVFVERAAGPEPLEVGLGPERERIVAELVRHTRADARVLWEDHGFDQRSSRWTVLLPELTGRSFVGGLDPGGAIEHSRTGLVRQQLCGQALISTSDEALRDYCERYNIGWAVLWSPQAIDRFRRWKNGAVEVVPLTDAGARGALFKVVRAAPTFVLKGKARVVRADATHITLADVVPDDGQVVLSFHFQAGLRATPSRASLERETGPNDPISLIRLRVASPVARLVLTWDGR